MTIPASVTRMETGVFRQCRLLEAITVDAANTVYHSVENCLIETNTKRLMAGCKNSVIPTDGSVEIIASNSLFNIPVESIVIPAAVTEIERYAFCDYLNSIIFAEGSKLTTIGRMAFQNCLFETIELPKTVTSIEYAAFIRCRNLEKIAIPASVTEMGMMVFGSCTDLETIYCEAAAKPEGWSNSWNFDEEGNEIPVVWGFDPDSKFPMSIQVNAPDEQIFVGDTFDVTIDLSENPGFACLILTPDYDKSALELVNYTNGSIIADLDVDTNIVWSAAEDATADGTLITLTFKALKEGDYSVNMIFRESYDAELAEVGANIENDSVSVISFIYGDADGDRAISGKDIVKLRRYIAAYDYDTGTSTVSVAPGADANGDGVIKGNDIVLLRRYIAGFDYDTGTSNVVLGPQK